MITRFLTPSTRIVLGILAVFILPYLVKITVLVPVVINFFPDSAAAVTVRRAIHVGLTVLAAGFAVPWMRLHRKEGLTAPITRVIAGAFVILFVPIWALRRVVEPLLGSTLPDNRLTGAVPDAIMTIAIVALYSLFFKLYEQRPIKELAWSRLSRETLVGFGVGFMVPALALGILFLGGVYSVTSINHPSILIPAFVSMTWVAVSEELFHRGVVYRITEESWGTHLAISLSALIFALAHLGNANVTLLGVFSAALGGVIFGLAYSFSGRLWLPIGGHLGWNFSQIFFGSSVSGVTEYGGFLVGTFEGPDLLTGGAFGVETSLPLLVLLISLIGVVYWKTIRRGLIKRPFWREAGTSSPILLGGST